MFKDGRVTKAVFFCSSKLRASCALRLQWRRRLLLLSSALIIACGLFTHSLAQAPSRGWLWQNPLPQGNLIYSIRFDKDKLHGWAVGADGAILRTENGGFEWNAQ